MRTTKALERYLSYWGGRDHDDEYRCREIDFKYNHLCTVKEFVKLPYDIVQRAVINGVVISPWDKDGKKWLGEKDGNIVAILRDDSEYGSPVKNVTLSYAYVRLKDPQEFEDIITEAQFNLQYLESLERI